MHPAFCVIQAVNSYAQLLFSYRLRPYVSRINSIQAIGGR
ncbi:hypothetical protein C4J95_3630 [Pseudomonas orientalis]|nr:hypothetical protein C4J96_3562 [Pseudomonas orientalis]AZF01075.1 hypothetical protein C4J95_3630 [Pseudomonas orientalis]